MSSKPVLVVTNPLHYTYFKRGNDVSTIGSNRGLVADYGKELGFEGIRLFDVANSLEALILADPYAIDTAYLTWKPVETTRSVLGNEYTLAHSWEKKAYIRSTMPSAPFPDYNIVSTGGVATQSYESLRQAVGSDSFVAQIDYSTGGKGTFFITNQQQFAVVHPKLIASGQDIVISRRVDGISRGLQCFIADSEIHATSWWHRDLVGIPDVCQLDNPHATRYCGAVLENIPEKYSEQISALIMTVGSAMIQQGYQGIFGIDIVVDETTERVYLIEINPRTTAVSHVYATAMRSVGYTSDFLTAQAELLTGISLIHDFKSLFAQKKNSPADYFYLKLQNLSDAEVKLRDARRMGVYDGSNIYDRFGFGVDDLQTQDEIIVIPEASHASCRAPGERVFSIIGTGNPIVNGEVMPEWLERISHLKEQLLM